MKNKSRKHKIYSKNKSFKKVGGANISSILKQSFNICKKKYFQKCGRINELIPKWVLGILKGGPESRRIKKVRT